MYRDRDRDWDRDRERDGYRTQYSRTLDRPQELRGEEFYHQLIQISKTDDVIGRMQRYFVQEIGMKLCPLGNFRNIFDRSLAYHRLMLSSDVIREFQAEDPRSIDWQGFIAKCKEEFSIS